MMSAVSVEYVEQFIVENRKESTEQTAEHTHEFIAELSVKNFLVSKSLFHHACGKI